MQIYNIGTSAIRANQLAMQTIANNIANADTDGYHKQQVNLVQNTPYRQGSIMFGTGVKVQGISRLVDSAADQAVTLSMSQSARAQVQLETLQSIESLLNPTGGSLQNAVSTFFDSAEALAASPSDNTRQKAMVGAAQAVATQITSLNTGLDQLQQQTNTKIADAVDQVNSLVDQIAAIEKQLSIVKATGGTAPTLQDQHDQLVQQLGEYVDISPATLSNPNSSLVVAGGSLVVGDNARKLAVQYNPDGSAQLVIGADKVPVQPTSGKLAGYLESSQEIIPAARDSLQQWTSAFVSAVNSVQSTGISSAGQSTLLTSDVSKVNATAPLSQSKSLFPVSNGQLSISVTNQATGARETVTIPISSNTDSLQSIVSQIDARDHVRASISSTGKLTIAAESGYSFDFAGRPSTQVDTSSMTGTAVPTLSGTYSGPANSNWTVTALASGQIGVTAGLKLSVTDSTTGEVVNVIDVGAGYQTGKPIQIADGLSVTLAPGTLVAGDSFNVDAITDPDSSGFLTAFGLGGIFQTTDLRNISVDSNIAKNPSLLATGRTGDVADGSQMNQLVTLRDTRVLANGTETIEGQLASITSNIGVDVNLQKSVVDQLQSQYQQLRDRQDSVSGVDPNEELLSMMQFQRSFQANARYLSSVNSALDDLLGMLR